MIAPALAARTDWVEAQKNALKTGRPGAALNAPLPHLEAPGVSDENAPVRACYRYLEARNDS